MVFNSQIMASQEKYRELEIRIYDYYRDNLGLPDWERRINSVRMNEEDAIASQIQAYAEYMNVSLSAEKALVIGCGTGAELFCLARNGV